MQSEYLEVFGQVDIVDLAGVNIDGVEAGGGAVHHLQSRPLLHRQVHELGLLHQVPEALWWRIIMREWEVKLCGGG